MMVAKVIIYSPAQFWGKFYNCSFIVLSIREDTVLVRSGVDEGFKYPYNVHEFPIGVVEIKILEE